VDKFLTLENGRSDLETLRASGALAFDRVPLVQIEGHDLVQVSSAARYLGRRLELLPSDADQAYLVESVWDSVLDARTPLLMFPFSSYPESPGQTEKDKTLEVLKGPKGLLGRFAGKWEKMLAACGGQFFLGSAPSIADVAVFEVLDFFRDVYGVDKYEAAFESFPCLKALVVAVKNLGCLSEHCEVGRKAYDTWDESAGKHIRWGVYAKSVRTTLD
jgi:glutathione S-transferase